MILLGIAVNANLLDRWRVWLAPEVQPFFVDSLRAWPKGTFPRRSLSPELRDTYRAWRVDRSLKTLWLDEAMFLGMSQSQRSTLVRAQVVHRRGAVPSVRRWWDLLDEAVLRSQADGHRFVWWPSLLATNAHPILSRAVVAAPDGREVDSLPSRHREVAGSTWAACVAVLPEARRVAGTFPPSSGPNCFATVMAAAGVNRGAEQTKLQAPFLTWLGSSCRPGGRDEDAGTVLVWRDGTGAPVHAAVTLGGGWALEKASQEWWTPSAVRRVGDVIRTTRMRGRRLERHHIQA